MTFIRDFPLSRTLACLLLVLSAMLSGCGQPNTPATATTGTASSGDGTAAPASAASEKAKKSKDLIRSILGMTKLESLGITAQEDELFGLINQWQRFSQGTNVLEDETALDESVLEAWKARLSERQVKLIRRTVFDRADIERLRVDLLMNAVVKHAAQGGKSDLDRVARVFSNLMRNTELIATHPDEVPLSPYQIYLIGKATAADRAWIFAEMLRQLKINSVILSAPLPKDADAWDTTQPFVVGVLLDKQVYLFDPHLGLPLTVPGMQTLPANIATLEQVRANPDILKQYALADDKPYRVTAELLKSPAVFVVGDPALWSYRLARLQKAFTGTNSMVISDPLIDVDGAEGQLTRVAKSSGQSWAAADLAIWDYPDSQFSGQESLSAQHQQTLTKLTDAWKTPVVALEVPQPDKTVIKVPRGTNLMLFSRLNHAQGKLDDAVKGYTRVRVQLKDAVDVAGTERLQYAYFIASEDALFWMAVCKFDQGSTADLKVAIDKFVQYLQVYQKSGRWLDQAHALLAMALAQTGDTANAIAEIKKISSDHPQHAGYQFLLRSWEKAGEKAVAK